LFYGLRTPSDQEAAEIDAIRHVVLTALTPFFRDSQLGFAAQACILVWASILKFANVTRAEARVIANQIIDGSLKDGN
jgi:hypothetical protein